MPAKLFFTRTGQLIAVVSGFCLLLIVLIWTQITSQLNTDREQTIEAAVQRNSNLAVSLEQYAIRTIRNADAVLQLVKKEYEEKGNKIDFNDLFSRGIIDVNYFNGVTILDAEGHLQLSNIGLPENNLPDFSDREYFHFHKAYRDSLHISKPLLSRTIGKTVIVVSRRINKPDGSFAGTVAVQVEPFTFTRFYAKANLRTNDIISLIAPTGVTYARRTGNKESHGEDISKSPLFVHVAKNPVNDYFARDAIRGIPTHFSYRKLAQYPVIATVGSAEKDILADYHDRTKREYFFGFVSTFVLVLFSFLICTFFIDRKKYVRTIKNSEARYRSIFENSLDAIILVRKDGSLEAMNEAAYKLFRIERDKANISTGELFHSSAPHISFLPSELMNMNPSKTEINFNRLDGSEFIGEIVHSNYRDVEGNCKFILLVRDITSRKQMEGRLLTEQKRYQRKLTRQIILAQEREREAIGHELHDNVNQILTTVKLYLEMARHNEEIRDELLPKSIHHINDCINEIRNLSHELSAPTLGTQSLIDSIQALVEMVESSGSFTIRFDYDNYHTTLEKDQRLAIYRILQEQLNNIIKHAKATEVTIRLSQPDGMTEIIITDNGKGFNKEEKRGGIGFNNMLSRAKVFGGKMQIVSAPGNGCTVQIFIPFIAAEANFLQTNGEQKSSLLS